MLRRNMLKAAGAAASLTTLGALAGCTQSDPGPAETSSPTATEPMGTTTGTASEPVDVIDVAFALYPFIPQQLPFNAAIDQGFNEDYNIELGEITSTGGGGAGLRTVLSSGVPLGTSPPATVAKGYLAGANAHIPALSQAVTGMGWMAMPDRDDLNDIQDLKGGGKIGVTTPGSGSESQAVLSVVRAPDITLEDVEIVYTGGLSEGMAALENGIVDVVFTPSSLGSRLLMNNERKIVWWSRDYFKDYSISGIAMSANTLNNELDLAQRILRMWYDGQQYLKENPLDVADLWAELADLNNEVTRYFFTEIIDPQEYWSMTPKQELHTNLELALQYQGVLGEDESLPKEVWDQSALPDELKADWLME